MKDLLILNDYVPNFIDEVMLYFAAKDGENIEVCRHRTLKTLSEYLLDKFSFDITPYYKELIAICESLCKFTPLVQFHQDEYFGFRNCYYWNEKIKDGKTYPQLSFDERMSFFKSWENAVFGSRHIYNSYREFIIPIIHTSGTNEGIGTGFLVGQNYVVTARHCIEGSTSISFGKLNFDIYRNAKVYYHINPNIDIAIIHIDSYEKFGLKLSLECKIFDKVITMGYPKIPGFTCFQTAEEAVISAIPEKRFTATEGHIAAEAKQIWSKENLFLVTAKVKGGNSGGPVLNNFGYCIGIVSEIPFSSGDYDDLGYGTVIPAKFIYEMIQDFSQHQQSQDIRFVEYPYDE